MKMSRSGKRRLAEVGDIVRFVSTLALKHPYKGVSALNLILISKDRRDVVVNNRYVYGFRITVLLPSGEIRKFDIQKLTDLIVVSHDLQKKDD
jgi:hypothetical protein